MHTNFELTQLILRLPFNHISYLSYYGIGCQIRDFTEWYIGLCLSYYYCFLLLSYYKGYIPIFKIYIGYYKRLQNIFDVLLSEKIVLLIIVLCRQLLSHCILVTLACHMRGTFTAVAHGAMDKYLSALAAVLSEKYR